LKFGPDNKIQYKNTEIASKIGVKTARVDYWVRKYLKDGNVINISV